jgi:hypothetical protein
VSVGNAWLGLVRVWVDRVRLGWAWLGVLLHLCNLKKDQKLFSSRSNGGSRVFVPDDHKHRISLPGLWLLPPENLELHMVGGSQKGRASM